MEKVRTRWGVRQMAWLILLFGIALAGNNWAPKLFTGFNYLFGSVGVLLILRLYGVVPAVIAAFLAAVLCRQLFGHYYMVFWLVPEPVFVWFWLRRRPNDTLIAATTAYWLLCGIPLIIFIFLVVLQVAPLGTITASLMYTVIGITNALFASLLMSQLSLEQRLRPEQQYTPVALAQFIFQVLMLAIVLPALVVLVISARSREQAIKQKMFDTLEIKARQVGQEVRQKIFKGSYPSQFDQEQRSRLDQAIVIELLKSIQPNHHMHLYLMVNDGEVVASTNPLAVQSGSYRPLQLGNVVKTEREQMYQRLPSDAMRIPLWHRFGSSSYLRINRFPATGFYSIAETPFAPYQAQILRGHRDALFGLLVYLVAGALLAIMVSRRIAIPLVQLSQTTTDLPGRLMTEDLVWPVSTIAEVRQLVDNARQMAHTLSGQFREITQMNDELEDRVQERTAELHASNRSLRQEIEERIAAERQRDHLMGEVTLQLRFLQTLMDAIPNPVYFKDAQGRYQGFNRAFGDVLGVTREGIIGKSAEDIFPAEQAVLYRARDNQLFAEGGVQEYESDLVYADGNTHTVIVSKATYHNLSGELSGLIGVFIDITERKHAECERDRLMRELESKNQELESIIYVSSHDLRSPLVNIQGFSRKLAKSCTSLTRSLADCELPAEQQQELLQLLTESMPRSIEYITGSVEKMDALLSGLLRLSRLGRAAVVRENLDMNLLMRKIINSLAFQIESSGGRITVDSLLPCHGDAVQVSQVFTNLLDNALKYRSTDRPLEVRISSQPCPDGVQYCVQDNGIGIHQDYQAQVWEIFQRINPRGIPGEGLGLTVCRRILDRLDGTIRLESEEGRGSRFYLRLPAQRS